MTWPSGTTFRNVAGKFFVLTEQHVTTRYSQIILREQWLRRRWRTTIRRRR